MKRIHIIGRKNHGKTTLVVELVEELTQRGLAVGTVKHTHHRHELDVPGKDSHRHRVAGAKTVGILSHGLSAIFLPTKPSADETQDRYQSLAPSFANCDLVLVEGDSQTDSPKIEVWRECRETEPIACKDTTILAVVTDDPVNLANDSTTILARADVSKLADWVLATYRDILG